MNKIKCFLNEKEPNINDLIINYLSSFLDKELNTYDNKYTL